MKRKMKNLPVNTPKPYFTVFVNNESEGHWIRDRNGYEVFFTPEELEHIKSKIKENMPKNGCEVCKQVLKKLEELRKD